MGVKTFLLMAIAGVALGTTVGAQTLPSITGPTNQVKLVGSNATFSVTVSGTAPFAYRWFFNTTNFIGATNISVTLTNVQLTNAGNYTVVVSNAAGSVTSPPAALVVNLPLAIFTVAGKGGVTGNNDGQGTNARFNKLGGIAVDAAGTIYVSDYFNSSIRKITPAGVVTRLTGGSYLFPRGLSTDHAGNVYEADFGSDTVQKITPGVGVKTLAGLFTAFGSNDGTNSTARFNSPRDAVVDHATGIIYVSDNHNHTIRKLVPDGTNWIVTTIAGQAGFTGSSDGIGSAASFNQPSGMDLDAAGNLYVADYQNHLIRKLSPAGTNWSVKTIGGRAGFFGSVDGPGNSAQFNYPSGLAVDGAGNVYVGDCPGVSGGAIRKMTPVGTNWVVGTVAGLPGTGGATDGTGSAARFATPADLRVDATGNLYIADRDNSIVRLGVANYGQPIITFQPQSQISYAGTNVIFNASVLGAPPLNYQWQFNGTNLTDNGNFTGSQTNLLTLASVLGTNAGSYQLVITNTFGSATSLVASLTVVLPPITATYTPADSTIGLAWAAVSGLTYQVQYKTNLLQPDWINWGDPITTNAAAASVLDATGTDPQRFYRVELVP